MLYKSNVLMYDRQTESLWSQVRREAVTGPLTGTAVSLSYLAATDQVRVQIAEGEELAP